METGFRKGKRFAIVRQKSRGIGLDSVKPKDAKALHRQILRLVEEVYPTAHVLELPGVKATPVIGLFFDGRKAVFLQANCAQQVVSDERTRDLHGLKVRGFPVRIVGDMGEARAWLRGLSLDQGEAA